MSDFVHLHVHSHFSMLDGLVDVVDLTQRAKELGDSALALTDHGNLFGMFKFWKECSSHNIKHIFGCEFYIARSHLAKGKEHKKRWHIVLLAYNREGFDNLLKLSTISFEDGFYYLPRIDCKLLYRHNKGLICLSACPAGEVGEAVLKGKKKTAKSAVGVYKDIFGSRFYIEIQPHKDLPEYNERLCALARETGTSLVATCDVHFLNPEDSELHRVLLNINTKGAFEFHAPDIWMKPRELIVESFKDMGLSKRDVMEAVDNTVRIASRVKQMDIDCSQKLPAFEEG